MKRTEYSIEKDGFNGRLYDPENRCEKAVIVFMGGESMRLPTAFIAEAVAKRGYVALTYIYFGKTGDVTEPNRIPLDGIEKALAFLRAYGSGQIKKIASYGVSLGGVLALATAVQFPETVTCAIAASTSHTYLCGYSAEKTTTGDAFLTYRGKEFPKLPCAPGKSLAYDKMHAFFDELYGGETPEDAVIPVEKINGPVYVLAGDMDESWDAAYSAEQIEKRLQENSFPFPHERLVYSDASHYIGVMPGGLKRNMLITLKMISKVERTHGAACRLARKDSAEKVFEWLRQW